VSFKKIKDLNMQMHLQDCIENFYQKEIVVIQNGLKGWKSFQQFLIKFTPKKGQGNSFEYAKFYFNCGIKKNIEPAKAKKGGQT
jgi:hypothetical protein